MLMPKEMALLENDDGTDVNHNNKAQREHAGRDLAKEDHLRRKVGNA